MKLYTIFFIALFYSCNFKDKDEVINFDSEFDSYLFSYYLNNLHLDSNAIKTLLFQACSSKVKILDLECQIIKCFNPNIEKYEFTYFLKFDSIVAVKQFENGAQEFSNNKSYDITADLYSVINNVTSHYGDSDSIKLFICELAKIVYIAPFNCGLNQRMNLFTDYCITNSNIKLLSKSDFENINNEDSFIRNSIENSLVNMPASDLVISECIENWKGPSLKIQFDSNDLVRSSSKYYNYYKTLSHDMREHETLATLHNLINRNEIIYLAIPNMQFFRVEVLNNENLISAKISWIEPRLIYAYDEM